MEAGKTDSQMAIERQRLNSLRRRMDQMSRTEEEAKQRKADSPRGGDSDDEPNPLDTIAKNQITILDQLVGLQKQIEQLKWITKDVVTVQGREDRYNKRIELALEIIRVLGNHQGSDKQELVGLAVMALRDEITPLVLVKPDPPKFKSIDERFPLKEVPSW